MLVIVSCTVQAKGGKAAAGKGGECFLEMVRRAYEEQPPCRMMSIVFYRVALSVSAGAVTAFVAASPARPLLGLAFCIAVYATNLLPYIAVTRCAFIYHYMPVSAFAPHPHQRMRAALARLLPQQCVHHDRCPLVFLTALHTHVCAACPCTRP